MSLKTAKPSTKISSVKASARRRSGNNRAYVNFFRIGALELERWRKEKDRELALEKIAAAEQRLAEINQEVRELLKETNAGELTPGETSPAAIPASPARQGFNIKY